MNKYRVTFYVLDLVEAETKAEAKELAEEQKKQMEKQYPDKIVLLDRVFLSVNN